MKNILKILLVFMMTCNSVFAAEYVRARHILVKDRAQAVEIKKSIDDGGSFGYYARNYSLCPSGQSGGSLGYFQRGQMVSSFEDAAFSLSPGQVSDPVQTDFGWHLIIVDDKK
jgi:parvulin-like peptidyl-prolyl isomerase